MAQDEGSTIGTSLVVFLLGVAVGATLAVLYAPMPGSEARAKVAEAASKVKDRASELAHEVAEKAKELRGKGKAEEGEPGPEASATAETTA